MRNLEFCGDLCAPLDVTKVLAGIFPVQQDIIGACSSNGYFVTARNSRLTSKTFWLHRGIFVFFAKFDILQWSLCPLGVTRAVPVLGVFLSVFECF